MGVQLNKESVFEMPAYGWRPRADQMPLWRRMMRGDFRRGVIAAHRRYGKDELGLQVMAVKAMQRVGSYWYALPQYAQARKVIWDQVNWRTKRTRIDDAFPPELVTKRDNQSMMLWLESGSTVQLVGSDQIDSLVGGGQVGIVLSEAALSTPKALQFFRPILEESGGWELQISTPRGKNHFYRSFLAAREDESKGDTTVLGSLIPATASTVFPPAQLHRIKMDLIREHGSTIGEAIFGQEYECSFEAAVVGAVWGKELEELELQDRVRPCAMDRRFPVHTSWDLGVADATVILFWQEIGGEYRLIDGVEANNIGLDHYIDILKTKKQENGYNYGTHYGPHDIQQREWARGISRMDEAKRLGLQFTRTPQTRIKTQIAVAAQLIRQMVVNADSEGAMAALDRFKGWRYPVNRITGALVETPLHDEHSHASSALCTFAVNVAKSLSNSSGWLDPSLHSEIDSLGGVQKFDPREFGEAPFSHAGSVSNLMRGRSQPMTSAFG